MRVNYKGNKMRKEAARKQEQEAKRLKRLNRNSEPPSTLPLAPGVIPTQDVNPSGL